MKILLIKGSLRGENSHSLMVARKFVEGICEETDSEVKEIRLKIGRASCRERV